jgi:hypothetical protein
MQMTASCDRLRCSAYPIAFATAFGPAYHSPAEWRGIGNQIDTAFIFARSDLVKVHSHFPEKDYPKKINDHDHAENKFPRHSRRERD